MHKREQVLLGNLKREVHKKESAFLINIEEMARSAQKL
jgi:hypothetical protein